MRVLVAEDDPGLRSVLERGLREHFDLGPTPIRLRVRPAQPFRK